MMHYIRNEQKKGFSRKDFKRNKMPDLVITVVVCIVGTIFLGSIVGMGVTSWQYNKKINECWLCEWEYVTVYTISRTNINADSVLVTYGYGNVYSIYILYYIILYWTDILFLFIYI